MKELFANIYEWFGLLPLYSRDLGDHLRGWDINCINFIGTPWYNYVGFAMIIVTLLFYALQYHIIDSSRFKAKHHWWIMALLIVILNFLIAFTIPFNSLQAGDYCNDLYFNVADCVGFGFSNALWSFILFLLLTSFKYPKYLSNNCRYTTFWKP
jgi:hypothetical protein